MILILLICQNLFASQSWDKVDEIFKRPSLCEALPNEETQTFSHESCTAIGGCDKWNYDVRIECLTNQDGLMQAKINYYGSDGKLFNVSEIEQADWESMGGNLLRYLARFTESYSNVFILDSVTDFDDQLSVNYSIKRSSKLIESGSWLISKDKSGSVFQQLLQRTKHRKSFIDETTTEQLIR